MKVSELTGAALDWAVAKCIYEPDDVVICDGRVFAYDDATKGFNPATNWALGGPIIEREGIALDCLRTCFVIDSCVATSEMVREGDYYSPVIEFTGSTPLIAAMRCYVASEMGEEVEVPEELLQGEQA